MPPSNPSLNLGKIQNFNPSQGAQGWPNPSVNGLGVGNVYHLFFQQGSMPFPSIRTSQVFPPLASAWNPYQGLSPSLSVPPGGNFPMYGNPMVGSGYPPSTFVPQGYAYGSTRSMSNPWQPGSSFNLGCSFQNIRNSTLRGWNSPDPPCLPFLETLNLIDFLKLMNDPICCNLSWPPALTKIPSDIPKLLRGLSPARVDP